MTAVPRTAASRASTHRQTELPLRGNLRESAWQHPPSAPAALLTLSQVARRTATGRKHPLAVHQRTPPASGRSRHHLRLPRHHGQRARRQLRFPFGLQRGIGLVVRHA